MNTLLMFVRTLINTPLEVSGINEKKNWPKSITTSPNTGFVLKQQFVFLSTFLSIAKTLCHGFQIIASSYD